MATIRLSWKQVKLLVRLLVQSWYHGWNLSFNHVVGRKTAKPGQDFFPLTVNYQEKTYAAGKIPGGFFKREGRPTEKETLTSRLIDRPIRPFSQKAS